MANGMSVHVTGLKELDRELRKLPDAVGRKALADALEDGAEVIVEEARRRVPVRTGKLKKAIKSGNRKAGKVEASVDVGIDYTFKGGAVRYGHLVEFGTKRGQRARPFMRPAFDAKTRQAVEEVKASLWRRILGAVRG